MRRKAFRNIMILFTMLFISMGSHSQTRKEELINFKKDSLEAVNLINQIDTLYKHEDFAKTSQLIEKAIPFCKKLDLTACLAKAYRIKGDIYKCTDNYIKALETLSTSLEYYKKLNDSKEIASIENRMGTVFRLKNNYPIAMEHYFEALRIYQSIGFNQGISETFNNIGVVCLNQKEYDKALEYYFKSLELDIKFNTVNNICILYLNIGEAYKKKKDYKSAIDFLLKSLILSEKLKDLNSIGVIYNEIGSIYTEINNLEQAKHYLNEAFITFTKLGDKSRLAECYIYHGLYYTKVKNYAQAIFYLNQAISLLNETGSKGLYLNTLKYLSEAYEKSQNLSLALKYYQEYISVRDSLFNYNNAKKTVSAELLYQFEKKQETIKLQQAKKDVITTEKLKQQKVFRNFLIIVVSLLVIFVAFVLSAYWNKQKANTILANQQNEILEKNEELLKQQEEILAQRDEIEQKNRILEHSQQIIAAKNERIISSIEYAQTIQQAILPQENQLSKFFNDHFVVFLPKDIVSGDFFWFSAEQEVVFAAVIDCTGHGVPGSFMSLIGNTLLNQIVNEWRTHDPALILEYLHQKVRKALQQDEIHTKAHASMDVCFVKINLNTRKLTFAGANRPLYVVQNDALKKIAGDKKSVGGFQRETRRYFTNHEILLDSNSLIYLTTDGFIDQMNPEKRKIGPHQLLKILEKNSNKSMSIQKDILLNTLAVYSNGEEQIDDICILGIKV